MNILIKKLKSMSYASSKNQVFSRNMFTQGAPMCKKIDEKLGQYFTTDNLLDDYDKVPKSILEPSSGEGNLLSLLDNKSIIDAIDIDNKVLEKSMENYPDVKHITPKPIYFGTP
jgi:hypothetical protein